MEQATTTRAPADQAVAQLCDLRPEELPEFLDLHPDMLTAEYVEVLASYARQHLRIDINQALRAGEAACAIAERVGSPSCIAPALRAKANALWFKGQCKPAVILLDRAVALFEESGRFDEVGRTLSTSIQPLILLGSYDRAMAAAERAKHLFTEQKDDLRLARLEVNIANIYHRQEQFAQALTSYERAYQKLVHFGDTEAIGVALHNMAVCLIGLDDFNRAMEVYAQARQFFEQHSMPVLVSQADYNIAYLYYLRGDYEQALQGLAAARRSCDREGDAYHAALCDLDESEIYLDLNLTTEALGSANRAIERFEALSMGYETARSTVNAAIAACRNADVETAVQLFEKAKAGFAREQHAAGEAMVGLYEAVLLMELGKLTSATELCLSAREYFEKTGLARKAVLCDLVLARLHHSGHDFESARAYCDHAIAQLGPLQAPTIAYQAFMTSGRIQEATGNEQGAFASYEEARRELENVRSIFQFEELKIAFMSSRSEVYSRLVRLCLHCGAADNSSAARALDYMEQAKSRSLLDSLTGLSQPLLSFTSIELDEDTKQLRERLGWYYRRIEREQLSQDGVDPSRLAPLWEQARECERALLDIRRTTLERVTHPSLAPFDEPTIETVRPSLEPHSAIVEYFQVDDFLIAAVLSPTDLHIVRLASMHEVQSRVRLLLFQLSKFRLGTHYTDRVESAMTTSITSHLHALHRLIFEPLLSHLSSVKHLVIVPHGALHQVPMQALYDGSEYLADRFTVSYSPSARMYAHTSNLPSPKGQGSLVLADQDDKAPWILQEAMDVAAVLPNARLLLGSEATSQTLEELGPSQQRIHIAAHGFFRRDNPMFSGVRLGNSHLSLYDLYRLRLPVDLLTLSGCATGMNVITGGDELIGLTRGLLYAGARSLVLTLWDVHDRSTAQFMCSFYRHLQSSGDKAASLREAMLEVRKEFPHPYYWAAFTLVGRS